MDVEAQPILAVAAVMFWLPSIVDFVVGIAKSFGFWW